jgi:hypothetical protein
MICHWNSLIDLTIVCYRVEDQANWNLWLYGIQSCFEWSYHCECLRFRIWWNKFFLGFKVIACKFLEHSLHLFFQESVSFNTKSPWHYYCQNFVWRDVIKITWLPMPSPLSLIFFCSCYLSSSAVASASESIHSPLIQHFRSVT